MITKLVQKKRLDDTTNYKIQLALNSQTGDAFAFATHSIDTIRQ